MSTNKKITKVDTKVTKEMPKKDFVPTPENKEKAKTNRIIALVLWLVAIAIEVFAIIKLREVPINITLIVISLVLMAILSISGSMLWKKANRLDPASEKEKFKFFVQNQLGLILSIIAFLPLIILLLTNEDLEKKDKTIVTGVAVVAFALAAFFGLDLNPPSVEKYTEEIAVVEHLMGENSPVYWTKSGRVYHLYDDCQHINTSRTDEIFEGSVPQAYELKNIQELCKTCEKRARHENNIED